MTVLRMLLLVALLTGCGDAADRVQRQATENKRLMAICEKEGLAAYWGWNGSIYYVNGCKPRTLCR